MKNGRGKSQFLLPAEWERTHQLIRFAVQSQFLQYVFRFRPYLPHSQSVNASVKFYILAHRQIFVQRKFLAHVSNVFLYIFLLFVNVKSGYRSFSGSRIRQAAKYPHGSGFSGSVGTQKTENFTFFYFERDSIDGGKISELFGEFFSCNGIHKCLFF